MGSRVGNSVNERYSVVAEIARTHFVRSLTLASSSYRSVMPKDVRVRFAYTLLSATLSLPSVVAEIARTRYARSL